MTRKTNTSGPQTSETPKHAANKPERGDVRSRTLKHMRRLLATTAVAGASLNATECPPVVCDPLPAPLDCTEDVPTSAYTEFVYANAQWLETETGFLASVNLEIYLYESDDELSFTGEPKLDGATLEEFSSTEGSMKFACAPLAETTSVRISIPVLCNGESRTLNYEMDVSGAPQDSAYIPITPNDDI